MSSKIVKFVVVQGLTRIEFATQQDALSFLMADRTVSGKAVKEEWTLGLSEVIYAHTAEKAVPEVLMAPMTESAFALAMEAALAKRLGSITAPVVPLTAPKTPPLLATGEKYHRTTVQEAHAICKRIASGSFTARECAEDLDVKIAAVYAIISGLSHSDVSKHYDFTKKKLSKTASSPGFQAAQAARDKGRKATALAKKQAQNGGTHKA